MSKYRKALSKKSSRRAFKRGTRVNKKNFSQRDVLGRGGIRL